MMLPMSNDAETLKRLTQIARAVAEATATRTQKANLPGLCDVVARALVEAARAHGIEVELACGRYAPDSSRHYRKYMQTIASAYEGAPPIGKRPITHYWVRWNGHHIDPTVKQFGATTVVHIGSEPFVSIKNLELLYGGDALAKRAREQEALRERYSASQVDAMEARENQMIAEIVATTLTVVPPD